MEKFKFSAKKSGHKIYHFCTENVSRWSSVSSKESLDLHCFGEDGSSPTESLRVSEVVAVEIGAVLIKMVLPI